MDPSEDGQVVCWMIVRPRLATAPGRHNRRQIFEWRKYLEDLARRWALSATMQKTEGIVAPAADLVSGETDQLEDIIKDAFIAIIMGTRTQETIRGVEPATGEPAYELCGGQKAVRKIKKAPSSDFYRQYELNGVLKQLREGRDSTALPWPWEAR